MKKTILLAVVLSSLLLLAACSFIQSERQTFAEARAEFTTTLTSKVNDQEEVLEPPEGVFTLDYYDSEVGKLAAYVSADPGDGKKHPLIIWVVGGWSYGISDLPWSYGEWENDQTASAFREAGILMMYPSFRGANGNPGYFETMYGEIDDIVSAYEYAASLPFVDPSRIYLGGHSTGGTRVLLAAAYCDKFRAVFSFGPIPDIGGHNRTQFTFDLKDKQERMMRSPIHWLDDITSRTFVMEGSTVSTAQSIKNMERKTTNSNVNIYLIEEADHFNILAPVTRLVAQKILADTGESVNITITQQELQDAMNQPPPPPPMPIMVQYYNEGFGIHFELPALWQEMADTDYYIYISPYEDTNFLDSSYVVVELYTVDEEVALDELADIWEIDSMVYKTSPPFTINGQTTFVWEGTVEGYYNIMAVYQVDGLLTLFDFAVPSEYKDDAIPMFERIMQSVLIDPLEETEESEEESMDEESEESEV